MYLNSIARSVFTLAAVAASAMACQNVAASVDCNPAPRVWRGDDGSKWIVSPAGNGITGCYLLSRCKPVSEVTA